MQNKTDEFAGEIGRQWNLTPSKMALAFAALALGATVLMSNNSSRIGDQIAMQFSTSGGQMIDGTVTGSVEQSKPRRYTIRRSVLQSTPQATCTIYDDGTREGDC